MNEKLKELKNRAFEMTEWENLDYDVILERFGELIVQECADTIENRTPGQMGKEGEGWTNGYDDGLKTSAFLIKKHFGVKE